MPNYLYLLVRNDMQSLGRGKSIAQGAHAANAFTNDTIIRPMIAHTSVNAEALAWTQEADGFGTTITLSASLAEIERKVELAKAMKFVARIVADPSYPLLDGPTLHILPNVVTGAYVFGDKEKLWAILGDLVMVKNDF